MTSRLNPYFAFGGTARQAMEFYKDVFGGELLMNTFGEYGDKSAPEANNIMHAQLETTNGLLLMASDMPPGSGQAPGSGNVSVCLSGDDDAELRGYWKKLSDGGKVTLALEKQMWGDVFGMCVDRFGIEWMVNIGEPTS